MRDMDRIAAQFEAEAIQLRSEGNLLFAHADAAGEVLRTGEPDRRGRLTVELKGHELELDATLSAEANAAWRRSSFRS